MTPVSPEKSDASPHTAADHAPITDEFSAFHQRLKYHVVFLQDKKLIAAHNTAPSIFDLLGLPEDAADINAIQDAFDAVSERLRRLQGQHPAAVSEVRTALSRARRIASDPAIAAAYRTWYRAEILSPPVLPAAPLSPVKAAPGHPTAHTTEVRVQAAPLPAKRDAAPSVLPFSASLPPPLSHKLWKRQKPVVAPPAPSVATRTSREWGVALIASSVVLLIASLLLSGAIGFGGGKSDAPEKPVVSRTVTRSPAAAVPVVQKRTLRRKEPVAFTVQERTTVQLPRGRRQIRQAGKAGVREITVEVTLQNGKEIARRRIGAAVVQAPITQIVLVGTASAKAVTAPKPRSTPKPIAVIARSRFCPHCGERLTRSQRFCSVNGKPI